jgi:hypothetical protein
LKKYLSRGLTVFLLLVFSCSLSIPANAAVYASDYLYGYSATLYPEGNGVMSISYTVIATDTLEELGVSKIVMEKKSGNSWIAVKTYTDSDYPELSTTNDDVHTGYILYNGVAGTEYRARVTIFGNTDYRTFNTAIKRAT